MVTEDLFGVASSCDKFRVSLPREEAFSAFKGGYGSYYSMERPFKVFVGIRHIQCSSPSRRVRLAGGGKCRGSRQKILQLNGVVPDYGSSIKPTLKAWGDPRRQFFFATFNKS
jgi:hypothetical protein